MRIEKGFAFGVLWMRREQASNENSSVEINHNRV